MPDEPKVETTETTTETVEPEQTEEFDKERAMATINKLREFEKEAEKLRKRVDAYEKGEAERKKAEMSEIERLQLELEEAKTKARQAELATIQRDIADKTGLPAAFANRLRGETPEELEEDAKALLEALPKKTAPNLNPTNPGGATGGETDAERRKRLGLI